MDGPGLAATQGDLSAATTTLKGKGSSAPVGEALAADAPAMEVLLERYMPVVRQIAGGFQRRLPRNVLRDDLIAAGMSGLWDALSRHGQGGGPNFDWYVRVRIRGAILDELRAQDWLPRRARARSEKTPGAKPAPVVVRFDDVSETEQARCLSTADKSSSEAAFFAKALREHLVCAVGKLPDRERHIVTMHYFRGIKFKDLGAELGVSEPRISQLHSRAMGRLRTLMDPAA